MFIEDQTGTKVRGSKEDALDELRSMLVRKKIGHDEALRLGLSAEEEGKQYIFLFAPKTTDARDWYLDPEEVAGGLFGGAIDPSTAFPVFAELPTGDAQWVDFRDSDVGAGVSWLAKLYVRYQVVEKVPIPEVPNGFLDQEVDHCAVVTARFRKHPGGGKYLLDLRVSRVEHRRGHIEEVLAHFWANAVGGIDEQDFAEYRLDKHLTRITEGELEDGWEQFLVWDPGVVDSSGWAHQLTGKGRGAGRDKKDRLASAPDRKKALEALLESGTGRFPVNKLVLEWFGGSPMPNSDSRVYYGFRGVNSLLVGARLSREAISHVIWETLSK